MKDWKFKYKPHEICSAENLNDEVVQVQIDGVVGLSQADCEPVYLVREIVSGCKHSLSESDLSPVAVSR
jgi:hypothetical protein